MVLDGDGTVGTLRIGKDSGSAGAGRIGGSDVAIVLDGDGAVGILRSGKDSDGTAGRIGGTQCSAVIEIDVAAGARRREIDRFPRSIGARLGVMKVASVSLIGLGEAGWMHINRSGRRRRKHAD
jgi:hypothetical protein